MGKGGSQTSSSTTKTDPWITQQPYLETVYKRAGDLYGHYEPIYETRKVSQPVATILGSKSTGTQIPGAANNPFAKNLPFDLSSPESVSSTFPDQYEQVQVGERWVEGEAVPEYFPGETVAKFTPEQTQGHQLITDRALSGSPISKAGGEYVTDVLSGKYLSPDSNPFLTYYAKKAQEDLMPSIDTTAIQSGRYGSGAWSNAVSDTNANIANEIYGGAYNTERGFQQALGQIYPELAQSEYYDYDRLLQIGAEKQAMEQAIIDAEREKWEFEQMAPWQQLAMYANAIGGDSGGTTTINTGGGGK